ncbi:hypothetical protein HDU98_004498 [Podochytrium sp. JEL0797]|nr:hypothetical protein HDU98_004498 [Podochytrium sp. JEL0797]
MSQQPLVSKTLEQSESYAKRLSNTDLNRFTKGFVRLALATHRTAKPLKRDDLIKKILTQQHAKAFMAVFVRAQKVLRSLFGCELVRLESKARTKGGKDQKVKEPAKRQDYILKSVIPAAQIKEYLKANENADLVTENPSRDKALAERTLLCVVLSLILAEKRAVSSDSLYKHLATLNIHRHRIHKTFHKIEDVIAQFVREEYIEKCKIDNAAAGEQAGEEFVWGSRAKVELTEAEVIQFVAKMFPQDEADGIKAILSQAV